jgi:transcription elongation GreA/GreB family factor
MKTEILGKIRMELRDRLDRLAKAAMEAHAAATDPGSKAESKYDTRNLEASYLASGQAKQVEDLAEAVRIFDGLSLPDYGMEDSIDAGALVEVEQGEETRYFLLAPVAGGLEIEHEGMEITLLTPESPLYRKLVGLRAGDSLDAPPLMVLEVF